MTAAFDTSSFTQHNVMEVRNIINPIIDVIHIEWYVYLRIGSNFCNFESLGIDDIPMQTMYNIAIQMMVMDATLTVLYKSSPWTHMWVKEVILT